MLFCLLDNRCKQNYLYLTTQSNRYAGLTNHVIRYIETNYQLSLNWQYINAIFVFIILKNIIMYKYTNKRICIILGEMTRQCTKEGIWEPPVYNCTKKVFVLIANKVQYWKGSLRAKSVPYEIHMNILRFSYGSKFIWYSYDFYMVENSYEIHVKNFIWKEYNMKKSYDFHIKIIWISSEFYMVLNLYEFHMVRFFATCIIRHIRLWLRSFEMHVKNKISVSS